MRHQQDLIQSLSKIRGKEQFILLEDSVSTIISHMKSTVGLSWDP